MDAFRWCGRAFRGCWYAVLRCLVAYGSFYLVVPEAWGAVAGLTRGRGSCEVLRSTPCGPSGGHPERLRPDLPLSAVERELARALLSSRPE
ncbi:DUF6059 family protein [Streptomyces sp. NPDC058049]|uniref:DUF6059 family protein n=1 Tax=Streptomyces sp. NPDC058049 TaxID=3346314 RepID=UPI0036EB82F2